jgi:ABC-type polysaccharide/polyol phosphate export permease
MGLLYGHLFKMQLSIYYPYLAASMLSWNLISSLLADGSGIFVESEHFLKQMKLPYLTFVLRTITKNFIIFFHNILVIIPIVIFFHVKINAFTLLFFIGLFVIWLNAVTYSTILAILGTRFRDITQLINSLIQVIFFLTPVMWSPNILPEKYQYIIKINPFAQFLSLLRDPLLGIPPPLYTVIMTLIITLAGMLLSFLIFTRYRARITYWL